MEAPAERYKEELAEDFSIEHKISDGPALLHFHSHDAFEIMLLLSDDTRCYIGDSHYVLAKNSVILFNNMDVHYLTIDKPTRYDRYVLYFRPEYIESLSSEETDLLECFFFRPFADANLMKLDEVKAAELLFLLQQVENCYKTPPEELYGRDLHLRFALGRLLLFVNNAYRIYHNIPSTGDISSNYRQVYPIINFIHQHMAEELSLEMLAQKFFMNKFYLCSLFKSVTGITPNQYLINCRIMKAKEYLSQNITVEAVCGLVGFNNLSHFSRSFKQHVGSSPKQFSQMMKKGTTQN